MKLFIISGIMIVTTIYGDNAATTDRPCALPVVSRSGKAITNTVAFVANCTGELPGIGPCIYDNGTRCPTRSPGYSNESTLKVGVCSAGVCTLPSISQGCWTSPWRREVPKNLFPVGCAFTCKQSKEYGYYPSDTPCQHVLPNGSRIATTCKPWNNGTICRTEEQMNGWLQNPQTL
uniref:Basic tail secreted protein n=1 Tax=Rhipicephalus appendiculatus TaxID=34631 RepID=A0A131YEJ1_RHIAP